MSVDVEWCERAGERGDGGFGGGVGSETKVVDSTECEVVREVGRDGTGRGKRNEPAGEERRGEGDGWEETGGKRVCELWTRERWRGVSVPSGGHAQGPGRSYFVQEKGAYPTRISCSCSLFLKVPERKQKGLERPGEEGSVVPTVATMTPDQLESLRVGQVVPRPNRQSRGDDWQAEEESREIERSEAGYVGWLGRCE